MKINFLGLLLFASVLMYTACDDDDPITLFDDPIVTAPSAVINVEAGAGSLSIDFAVSIDPDLTATYQATASGGSVTPTSGSVSGNTVSVDFTPGANPGAASVTLTVTDSEGQSDAATAVINIGAEESVVRLTSNVTSNTTWTADKVYILGGRITVEDGATLTIEPGTVIKGEAGTGANATALLVARGGKLIADGTATAPIIFTSVADELTPEDVAAGDFESPNLDSDINGLWGGVIVLGRAPISASNDNGDVSEVQIEGIPTSDPNGLYGGSDPADNSGVIRYISIRHGGANIGAGNEINGLSLGGIGTGTVVENIEVVANQDDGIEWFGGTVDVKNVLVWNVGDDGIDTDQSWSGSLENFVVVASTGHAFELDGPEGSFEAGHRISKGTVVASNGGRVTEDLINVDENSIVDLVDIHFLGIVDGQRINRVTAAGVTFTGITFDVPAADLANYVNGAVPDGVTAGGSPQADVSVLNWTWAAQSGALDNL
jgi:hypothetical protein